LVRADHSDGLTATATELLTLLNASDLISEGVRKQRSWPQTPQGLGNRVERIMPLLRAQGFAIERRHSGVRNIIIMPPAPKCDAAD
jgi:putative DNA primase/helicase